MNEFMSYYADEMYKERERADNALKWHTNSFPGIPAIQVLCTIHDPIYAELTGSSGNSVIPLMWDGVEFKDLSYGPDGTEWVSVGDKVIAWMYLPEPYKEV